MVGVPGFIQNLGSDRKTNDLTLNVKRVLDWLSRFPLASYQIIEDASLTGSVTTEIRHNLGRVPKGYIVISQTAGATVFKSGVFTSTVINIESSSTQTVSLFLF
jgi:hypothetical protein